MKQGGWLRATTWLVAMALCAVGYSPAAKAHAFPTGSQPAVGSTINSPPSQVIIDFDSPIEAMFAKLQVLDSSDADETAGPPTLSPDHRQLFVPLKPLHAGDFMVKWRVVAKDGHATEGSFGFTVAGAGS